MDDQFPNRLSQAQAMYPALPKNIAYKENFGSGGGRGLEYYPQGERDSFDASRPALEVFDKNVRPQDIAADLVSHNMIDSDPMVGQTYRSFLMSMTPWQQQKLQQQYQHAQKNFGEERDFGKWSEMTGQPAWFRGHAFGQWEDSGRMYTPQQTQMLDAMVRYLRGNK